MSKLERHSLAEDPLTPFVLDAAEAVGSFIAWWGFKSIHGRIWTVLALRKTPVSQSELANILGVSRALVCTAMSELGEYGLVEATSDHRNAPYASTSNIWRAITKVLREREWILIERIRLTLESTLDEAEAMHDDEFGTTHYDHERIRKLLRITELAQFMLKLICSIGSPTKVAGFGQFIGRVAEIGELVRKY